MKKSSKRVRAVAGLRLDAYRILSDAIEIAVATGWRAAYKHSLEAHQPAEHEAARVCEAITLSVQNAIAGLLEPSE